jgi:hypothetical protein
MKNQELMLTALFIVFGVVLVTGLVIVPILEEADAKLYSHVLQYLLLNIVSEFLSIL